MTGVAITFDGVANTVVTAARPAANVTVAGVTYFVPSDPGAKFTFVSYDDFTHIMQLQDTSNPDIGNCFYVNLLTPEELLVVVLDAASAARCQPLAYVGMVDGPFCQGTVQHGDFAANKIARLYRQN